MHRERERCLYSLSTSCIRSSKEVVPPYPDALAREIRAARHKSFMMAMSEGYGTGQLRTRLDFPPKYTPLSANVAILCLLHLIKKKSSKVASRIHNSALLPSLLDWLMRKQRKMGSRGSVVRWIVIRHSCTNGGSWSRYFVLIPFYAHQYMTIRKPRMHMHTELNVNLRNHLSSLYNRDGEEEGPKQQQQTSTQKYIYI